MRNRSGRNANAALGALMALGVIALGAVITNVVFVSSKFPDIKVVGPWVIVLCVAGYVWGASGDLDA